MKFNDLYKGSMIEIFSDFMKENYNYLHLINTSPNIWTENLVYLIKQEYNILITIDFKINFHPILKFIQVLLHSKMFYLYIISLNINCKIQELKKENFCKYIIQNFYEIFFSKILFFTIKIYFKEFNTKEFISEIIKQIINNLKEI